MKYRQHLFAPRRVHKHWCSLLQVIRKTSDAGPHPSS